MEMNDGKTDGGDEVSSNNTQDEPLLQEPHNRFVMFPIQMNDVWASYKKQLGNFWIAEEIHLNEDLIHWKTKLNDDERHFIKFVLAFFAASDGIVLENLLKRFTEEISIPEVRATYTIQAAIENIHSEVYSLLIDTYITDNVEKDKLLNAVHTIPCVTKKAKWALKWIGSDTPFALRLIAFACVEGIFFSGSFCAIYWLKERGIMPGLTYSNELIARDEGMHTDFAALLYTYVVNRIPEEEVVMLFKEAVEVEHEFITESLPCRLIGMNANSMYEYIKFVADRLIVQLGYDPIYNANCPFDFMERISLTGKTNFFEKRVSEYQKAGIIQNEGDNYEDDDDF